MPRNPENREDIPVLPQEYPLTANGDPFLIFECGVGDQERTRSGRLKDYNFWPILLTGMRTFKVFPEGFFPALYGLRASERKDFSMYFLFITG